jgi:hypothetical protein
MRPAGRPTYPARMPATHSARMPATYSARMPARVITAP